MIGEAQAGKQALSVGLCGNAADVYPEISPAASCRTSSPTRPPRTISSTAMCRPAARSRRCGACEASDPKRLMEEATRSIVRHVTAMLEFQKSGAVVFDNGNLIRTQAKNGGVGNAFDIPIFTEAFLRPLFARAIGPFRWIALSNDPDDIRKIDDVVLERFGDNQIVSNWIRLARKHVPFEGLPARIAWLGHGERTELGACGQRDGARRRRFRRRSRSRATTSTPAPWRIPTS